MGPDAGHRLGSLQIDNDRFQRSFGSRIILYQPVILYERNPCRIAGIRRTHNTVSQLFFIDIRLRGLLHRVYSIRLS